MTTTSYLYLIRFLMEKTHSNLALTASIAGCPPVQQGRHILSITNAKHDPLSTFIWPVQLCFPVEQHVGTFFPLELLLYVRLPDGSHSGVVQVKPVATLLTDRRMHHIFKKKRSHKMSIKTLD